MITIRVWYRASGQIAITVLPKDNEERQHVINDLLSIYGPNTTFEDFTEAEFSAMYPKLPDGSPARSLRDKFRKNLAGKGFIVDPAVKTQREKKLEKLNAANTVPELRELLKEFLGL